MQMSELEKYLAEKFNKKYAIYTANGTTALYLIFKAMAKQEKKVLFPGISCTTPINAAIFAGYEVDFCDVNINDYTMDIDGLKQAVERNEYGIVVPTHIYGHQYNEKIHTLSKAFGISIIEDAAQTYKVGMSDASVMSFGHTKIYENSQAGGAIFTDDEVLADRINEIKLSLPRKPHNSKELFDEYREKYYKIANSELNAQQKNSKMKELQLGTKEMFIYHEDTNNTLINVIEKRDNICKNRIKKQQIYRDNLKSDKIQWPIVDYTVDALWRLTFLFKGDRDKLLELVREKGVDISSWYPSLSEIYKNTKLENASRIQRQVVNLWIDENHSIEKIQNDINTINAIMEVL